MAFRPHTLQVPHTDVVIIVVFGLSLARCCFGVMDFGHMTFQISVSRKGFFTSVTLICPCAVDRFINGFGWITKESFVN